VTRKRLAIYLMAARDAPGLASAAVSAGADVIELGFPFSDPLADGPLIRRAAERALAGGMRTSACLECLSQIRSRTEADLVPMTYASLLEAYGYERFDADARACGATGLIVADLPADAAPGLRRIQLVAPTTPLERIELAARRTDGWLYLVSLTGTTGPRDSISPQVVPLVERARAVTEVPLYVGFGISTPDQAAQAVAVADGVVVGSAAIAAAERGGPRGLAEFVGSLRRAIDRVSSPLPA
jgi:tryptophan synthase alpha chain